MIVAGQRLPIRIATLPVDFRCGHRALPEAVMRHDPANGAIIMLRSLKMHGMAQAM